MFSGNKKSGLSNLKIFITEPQVLLSLSEDNRLNQMKTVH